MKSTATGKFRLSVLLAVGMLGMLSCTKQGPAKRESPPPPEVTVAKPTVRQVTDYFEFPGRTAAVGQVDIRSRVTGYLEKVNFEDGQSVKKGDLLYVIDPRPYQAVLDRAEGELARLQALLRKAKLDLARSKKLRPSGAISEDELEQRVEQVAVEDASTKSAEAAVRDAQLNLDYTKITSPIDGRVSRTMITPGNFVQPGLDPDTVLTTVVTTNPIYVYFNIDEPTLLKYQELARKAGQPLTLSRLRDKKYPVQIGLEDETGFPHEGTLDFVDNRLDRGTGTLRVRGVFQNKDEYLTPGMFVHVRIPFGKPHPALLVPERAIQTDQRIKYLLTVDDKNVVQYREVKLGRLQDGMREIVSGIGPNDRVVIDGLQKAIPGKPVAPHPPAEKQPTKDGR